MEQFRSPVEGYGRVPISATIVMPIYILTHCETSQVKLSSTYHVFIALQDFYGQAPIPESD
jgi:hypothetical protein